MTTIYLVKIILNIYKQKMIHSETLIVKVSFSIAFNY